MRMPFLLAVLAAWALVCAPAAAQDLTPPQQAVVKAGIEADPILNALPATCCESTSGAGQIAAALNAAAAPSFPVWKTSVGIGEVGRAFNAAELAGLSSLNHTRLQTLAIYLASGVNPSLTAVRAFFDDIFSGTGGTNTRASLLALWKRNARRIEKMLATGTGSDASPATLGFEGAIGAAAVHNARFAQ